MSRPWRESLRDLGAVLAIHGNNIHFDDVTVVRSLEDFDLVVEETRKVQRPSAQAGEAPPVV
jgi:hypothetical protein